MIYYSSDFQCPDTGIPVTLIYDDNACLVTAKICTLLYSLDKNDNPFFNERLTDETQEWCDKIHIYVYDFDEANDIAEKYDCWF